MDEPPNQPRYLGSRRKNGKLNMNIFLIFSFFVSSQLLAKDPDWTQLYKKMRKGVLTQSYGEIPNNLWEDVSSYKKEGERWCFVGDSGVPSKAHKNLEFPFYFYAKKFGSVCIVAADTTVYYRGKKGDPRIKEQSAWFVLRRMKIGG